MRLQTYRGYRIRASDKSLVFRFSAGLLLLLFLAVVMLLNLKSIITTDWKAISLFEDGSVYLPITPYRIVTIIVATLICVLSALFYRRFQYDRVKQLFHRQKLARMILENGWYESESTQDSGFFKDLPASGKKEKINYFPKLYYRMEHGLLYIRTEITLGKYQDQLLHLEKKLETGLYCELVSKELHDSYVEYVLLYDTISFYLPEGCITGFVGINGAGKTTTLRSILGLTNNVSGKINFFGMDIKGNESEIKDRIGIVLDDGCFYDELTISEMKSVIAPAYKNWCEQDFIDYLERFELNPKQKINTLSKGMRMKYALALALSHKAELLIMDEPTSGLDPLVRSQLLDILKDYMNKDGKGIFFSTHITSDLDKIADMLIMIDSGQIVFQEEKDQLLDSYRIIKGSAEKLNSDTRKMFLCTEESAFNFTGITKQASVVMECMQDVLIERPTIEDIMLANVERRKKNVI